jgi:hypothetical protein
MLGYIFLIVFLFSVLPAREIGKLLGKQQTTEEVHDDDAPDGDDFAVKLKKETDPFTESAFYTEADMAGSYNHKMQVAIYGSSVLPDHFVPRIPTPPPNIG